MDDFNNNFNFGSGDSDDSFFGREPSSIPPEIKKFNESLSRGLTTKIPANVMDYLRVPTVGETRKAAMYMAKNNEVFFEIHSKPGPYSISEEKLLDEYTMASSIVTTSAVSERFDEKSKEFKESASKFICAREVAEHHRKIAESGYVEELYKKGYLDFDFDEEGSPKYTFTELGKVSFVDLLAREWKSGSLFSETLQRLAENDPEIQRILEEEREKTSLTLGKLAQAIEKLGQPSNKSSGIYPDNTDNKFKPDIP